MAIDPKAVRVWVSIFRDLAMVTLAVFILVYETVVAKSPNVYLVGAGLTLIGIPPALRLDAFYHKAGE